MKHMAKQNIYEIPEDLWKKIVTILPRKEDGYRAGRPRKNDKQVIAGIVYREQLNLSWHDLPKEFGSKSTIHRRYAELTELGVLAKILKLTTGLYESAASKKKEVSQKTASKSKK